MRRGRQGGRRRRVVGEDVLGSRKRKKMRRTEMADRCPPVVPVWTGLGIELPHWSPVGRGV